MVTINISGSCGWHLGPFMLHCQFEMVSMWICKFKLSGQYTLVARELITPAQKRAIRQVVTYVAHWILDKLLILSMATCTGHFGVGLVKTFVGMRQSVTLHFCCLCDGEERGIVIQIFITDGVKETKPKQVVYNLLCSREAQWASNYILSWWDTEVCELQDCTLPSTIYKRKTFACA